MVQSGSRFASPAPALAQTEVRAGAVLPDSHGPEHQAASAVPQPTDNSHPGNRLLAEARRKTRQPRSSQPKRHSDHDSFNTHRPFHSSAHRKAMMSVIDRARQPSTEAALG